MSLKHLTVKTFVTVQSSYSQSACKWVVHSIKHINIPILSLKDVIVFDRCPFETLVASRTFIYTYFSLVHNMTTCRRSFSDPTISKFSDGYLEPVPKESKRRRRSDITDFRSKRRHMHDNLLQLEKRRNALRTKDDHLRQRQQRLHLLLLDMMSQDEVLKQPTCEVQSENDIACSCVCACSCPCSSSSNNLLTRGSDRNTVEASDDEEENQPNQKAPEIVVNSTDYAFVPTIPVKGETSISHWNILSCTSSFGQRNLTYCKRLKHFLLGKIVCCSPKHWLMQNMSCLFFTLLILCLQRHK